MVRKDILYFDNLKEYSLYFLDSLYFLFYLIDLSLSLIMSCGLVRVLWSRRTNIMNLFTYIEMRFIRMTCRLWSTGCGSANPIITALV